MPLVNPTSGGDTATTEGALIASATAKTTPVDADYVGLMDSAASNILKKLSWANIKATLKTYFDTLYAPKTLFGYSNGQSITSGSATPITGCSVTVADDTFYQVGIWIAVDVATASAGDISTTGTAVFTGLLYGKKLSASGSESEASRPASFTMAVLGAEEMAYFSGTIQVTTPGTIILNGLSTNTPDAFVIDEARIILTPIGAV